MKIVRRMLVGIAAVALSLSFLPATAAPTGCSPEANCMCYITGVQRTPPDRNSGGTLGALKFETKKQCVEVPTP
jgi:hypothetical protein